MVNEFSSALNGKRIALMVGLLAMLVAAFAYAGAQNKADAAAFLAHWGTRTLSTERPTLA